MLNHTEAYYYSRY